MLGGKKYIEPHRWPVEKCGKHKSVVITDAADSLRKEEERDSAIEMINFLFWKTAYFTLKRGEK